MPTKHTLRVTDLQILDGQGNVRAEMSVGRESDVSLTMTSKDKEQILELGSGGALNQYSSAGHLLIRDGKSTPIIALGAYGQGQGSLLFSTAKTRSQVAIGYQPYGDVIDGHDRAVWGIGIRGADHAWGGIGARTDDGVFQEFVRAPK